MRIPMPSRRDLLSGLAASSVLPLRGAEAQPRLLLSGGSVVYDAALAGAPDAPRWEDIREWNPAQSKGLPPSYTGKLFQTTDDCKTIDNGANVLVTASSGGVAIYERSSGNTSFFARVANAHSACMLPGGHIVVASSVSAEGNALVLFHRASSERALFRTPLESAHGVVWDDKRKTLYALGMESLEEYAFSPGEAQPLNRTHRTDLPTRGGHELAPTNAENELIVTTEHGVYRVDKSTRSFSSHPLIGADANVKCVSTHPKTGRIAYVKADEGPGVWWSSQLRFLDPQGSIESPGQRLYKVRWA